MICSIFSIEVMILLKKQRVDFSTLVVDLRGLKLPQAHLIYNIFGKMQSFLNDKDELNV